MECSSTPIWRSDSKPKSRPRENDGGSKSAMDLKIVEEGNGYGFWKNKKINKMKMKMGNKKHITPFQPKSSVQC